MTTAAERVWPPVAYYGGKTRLADRIVAMLPAHRHYVEPYEGSLAVLLAKPVSLMETANDIDGRLVTFWRVLRDRPVELARVCALTPHARAEHAACMAEPVADGDQVETARRVWVILTQGRSGIPRKATGWRHHVDPSGSRVSMPAVLAAYVDRMMAVAGRLRSVSLECRPALDLIDRYGRHPGVLVYADPPYPAGARTSTGDYAHEMTDADHRELADTVRACRAAVVLSGYDSPLYDELYADWHRAEIPTGTTQGGHWSARTEVLWSNRPLRPTSSPHLF